MTTNATVLVVGVSNAEAELVRRIAHGSDAAIDFAAASSEADLRRALEGDPTLALVCCGPGGALDPAGVLSILRQCRPDLAFLAIPEGTPPDQTAESVLAALRPARRNNCLAALSPPGDEREECFRRAAAAARIGIWELDLQENEVRWLADASPCGSTAAGEFRTPYPRFLRMICSEDREVVDQHVQRCLRTGEPLNVEFRLRHLHRQGGWTRLQGGRQPGADGRPRYLVGVALDVTEHRRTLEQVRRQFQELAALRAMAAAIVSNLDLHVSLTIALDQLPGEMHVDAACVLLWNLRHEALEYAAGRGFGAGEPRGARLRLGQGLAGRAALHRIPMQVADLDDPSDAPIHHPLLASHAFTDALAVPLVANDRLLGVVELFSRSPIELTADQMEFLSALVGELAVAVEHLMLIGDLRRANEELVRAYDGIIQGWAKALDLRDTDTEDHTLRVTEMTVRLAEFMGISKEELVHIRRGALLHDIGKMGVPDAILFKEGKLSPEEWDEMRMHPFNAYKLLCGLEFLRPALDIVLCHHERWDGTGYPYGLQGEEIPMAARIFAVVDVWDALRSNRPYRKALPEDEVRRYIAEQSGKHFDPAVADAFLRLLAGDDEVQAQEEGASELRRAA
ncbi:MAG: HD domain-containing phosphohydrolase [Chthonomonadales bacterium]